jgi:DNA gyrase subunit A
VLGGAGKGSMVMKVGDGERVIGAVLAVGPRDAVTIETEKGKLLDLTLGKVQGSRGAKGEQYSKRDRFVRVVVPPPAVPTLEVI